LALCGIVGCVDDAFVFGAGVEIVALNSVDLTLTVANVTDGRMTRIRATANDRFKNTRCRVVDHRTPIGCAGISVVALNRIADASAVGSEALLWVAGIALVALIQGEIANWLRA